MLKYFIQTKRPKVSLQFEIIINVLVSSFRFIWIPILWVYGHYTVSDLRFQCGIRLWMWESDVHVGPLTKRVNADMTNSLYVCIISWLWYNVMAVLVLCFIFAYSCFNVEPPSSTLAQHYNNFSCLGSKGLIPVYTRRSSNVGLTLSQRPASNQH